MTDEVMEKSAISATPETIKRIGNLRTNYGSSSPSSSGEKVLSRYLRASVGSCHDLCKHGRKNITEEEKHPIPPTFLSNNIKSNKKRSSITEGKKRVMAKLKATPPKKIGLLDDHKVIEDKTESPTNGNIACCEPNTKKKNTSLAGKRMTSLATQVIKQKMPPPFKGSSTSSRPQVIKHKVSSPSETVGISSRSAFPLKTKTLTTKSESPPNPSGSRSDIKFQKKEMITSLDLEKTGGNAVLKSLIPPLSPETHADSVARLRPSSPVGISEEVKKPDYNNEGGTDEILDIIEPQQDIIDLYPLTSSFSDEEEEIDISEYTYSEMSETESEDEETESGVDMSKQEYTVRSRRNATVHHRDKFSPPYKLKFRRGKVVELLDESDAPRRLRFTKRRVVPENLNGNVESVSSLSRVMDLDGAALNDQGAGAENVLLRHQDIEGKKDTQGLFNNVIEETASKLVETRKSKVKALVGAFETVISLQESKPASAV